MHNLNNLNKADFCILGRKPTAATERGFFVLFVYEPHIFTPFSSSPLISMIKSHQPKINAPPPPPPTPSNEREEAHQTSLIKYSLIPVLNQSCIASGAANK